MKKHFANYNQSLALKELGFDEPCFAAYSEDEDNSSLFIYWNDLVNMSELFISQDNCEKFDYECLAPTFSQVFEWFREKHDLHIGICHTVNNKFDCWTNNGNLLDGGKYCDFKTYKEAESACIDKLIEIVKNK